MDVIPFSIKIKQINQTDNWKAKGNTQTMPPTLSSFNQIFDNIHNSNGNSELKELANSQKTTNKENNMKSLDSMGAVKSKLSALIALLTARIQETQKQQNPILDGSTIDRVSQFPPIDASISLNSLQQDTRDISINESLFPTVLGDIENEKTNETTVLLKQALNLIEKLPLEEKQKWLEGIELINFQSVNQLATYSRI